MSQQQVECDWCGSVPRRVVLLECSLHSLCAGCLRRSARVKCPLCTAEDREEAAGGREIGGGGSTEVQAGSPTPDHDLSTYNDDLTGYNDELEAILMPVTSKKPISPKKKRKKKSPPSERQATEKSPAVSSSTKQKSDDGCGGKDDGCNKDTRCDVAPKQPNQLFPYVCKGSTDFDDEFETVFYDFDTIQAAMEPNSSNNAKTKKRSAHRKKKLLSGEDDGKKKKKKEKKREYVDRVKEEDIIFNPPRERRMSESLMSLVQEKLQTWIARDGSVHNEPPTQEPKRVWRYERQFPVNLSDLDSSSESSDRSDGMFTFGFRKTRNKSPERKGNPVGHVVSCFLVGRNNSGPPVPDFLLDESDRSRAAEDAKWPVWKSLSTTNAGYEGASSLSRLSSSSGRTDIRVVQHPFPGRRVSSPSQSGWDYLKTYEIERGTSPCKGTRPSDAVFATQDWSSGEESDTESLFCDAQVEGPGFGTGCTLLDLSPTPEHDAFWD